MNLANLFGNKSKVPEPEYFLAVEIHESLIKTALWEILEGQPEIVNVGSYESWTDEESLINGVDSSLEQAIKVIKGEPKRVIFGLPDSWMEQDKIHATKTKLITHLCKELGLNPIGVVTTNRAVAHYLKKREGMPPTVILLEVYTSKVAVSYVYLGEVKQTEEAARSGDLAHDVEEGLTRMDLPNYPARFILTNGNSLEEESQQITAFPWTDRLPFKHIPKVEVLPIDFSIKSIALTGGVEAVQFLGVEVVEDESSTNSIDSEDSNLVIPVETPSSMEELGFAYEETSAPTAIPVAPPIPEINSVDGSSPEVSGDEPEYAFSDEVLPDPKPRLTVKLPPIPKFHLPSLPRFRGSWLMLFIIPVILVFGFVGYLYFGQAKITIHFDPQKISRQIGIAIAQSPQAGIPTLIASMKTFSGTATESVSTTGTATVGDKATGTITIANKSAAPIVLKAGTTITNDTGKYIYSLVSPVTVASASSDPIDPISGKANGVQVSAVRIGAEYNLTKNTIFSVDNFSKTIAAAIAESDFTGGNSRTVTAVSKADQDKVLATATEKIKSQVKSDSETQTPGFKTLPLSDVQFTKKQFDRNLNEEATTISLILDGSLDALVYSEEDLYNLVAEQIKDQIPAGSSTTKETTVIRVENPIKVDGRYQAKINIDATLFPKIDEVKLSGYIRGKVASGIRHFFEPISGFTSADIKIYPPIPLITKILPWNNIKFEMVGN
ncbi:TPA: hypothetical protein DIU27_00010 [Candidatus Collierbacteria bacterium]|uniref:Baseplate protein J-like domain-containing protein n=1 Tax=Candidatus Collierbacteria bacterium GW2011_GWB2_44_22 TaxID=1618387 RepID=A0A0G1I0M7_9BACT|nr:MAG: hypothetical protein UW31_C0004G0051 [Candidatus Collierbacteria bacterium GW2011_GWA2_44_13]KKT52378.1 MAG: hypothetical protein UW44_C0002G0044 [Candidatus Collierbacteria bacterium GW2011_GWB2_44_22]KKT62830.1 MAG: hypothetical protein UW56_C0003G0016 [Candidatus Collierbacteria bacterium GW2011_GWD1_44_27]KKT64745.1 MAG: hypothetical protein UW58_C0037G0009 [Candidatus Collierbacteria bacterium GW2011_GWC2_44_30]KKT69280.1 MAG: hypothetical protein UW64_C0002G0044 [Microgenomates gr